MSLVGVATLGLDSVRSCYIAWEPEMGRVVAVVVSEICRCRVGMDGYM